MIRLFLAFATSLLLAEASFAQGVVPSVQGPSFQQQGAYTVRDSGPTSASVSVGGSSSYAGAYPVSGFLINDNAQMTGAGTTLTGFKINQLLNAGFGISSTGSRSAFTAATTVTATPGNACCSVGPGYVALDAYGAASAPSFGTGTTFTTSSSGVGAANFVSTMGPTATNYFSNQILEADTSNALGSSLYANEGIEIVQLGTDKVAGATVDCAFCLTNAAGAVGWRTGLQFGNATGYNPVQATGTLIGCQGSEGSLTYCGTVGYGIDWRNYNFASFSLALPGFTVSPLGVPYIGTAALPAGGSGLIVQSNDGGNEGGQIQITNSYAGVTNPSKFMRVGPAGDFQMLNSGYGAVILAVTDAGALSAPGVAATGASAATTGSNIAFGTTTTAASSCGSLSGAAGCLKFYVGATPHYLPYW